VLTTIAVEQTAGLATKYFDPGKLIFLAVGDSKSILPQMREFGLPEPQMVDEAGP